LVIIGIKSSCKCLEHNEIKFGPKESNQMHLKFKIEDVETRILCKKSEIFEKFVEDITIFSMHKDNIIVA
jgi:hypothetical protein